MAKEITGALSIERSINKKYRKTLWTPFVKAIKKYWLIEPGDEIGVCISGGKDSMCMAVLFKMIHRITEIPFGLKFIVMDPGYNESNKKRIVDNAALCDIPITIFENNIFDVANSTDKNPCYLCARMRRGALYSKARDMGCNKIALGHHFSDVIETTVMAMFYGSQLQGMMPKLHSTNFPGMELIRPMYMIHEDDIISWAAYNDLHFLQCACRFTEQVENSHNKETTSKRREIKELIRSLKATNPGIESSIFNSIHNLCLDTFPSYKTNGELHSFLDGYYKD